MSMNEDQKVTTTAAENPVPDDVLIILPVRNTVVFPGAVIPLTIGRRVSLAAAEEAARSGRRIGLVMQRDPSVNEPAANDLHPVGTIARVVRYFTARDGTQHVVCQGEQRFRVLDHLEGLPFLAARFDLIHEPTPDTAALEARALILKERAIEAIARSRKPCPNWPA
jgi:ATP-dependent Lon protease